VLLIVAWIGVLAANVEQLIIDAYDLGVVVCHGAGIPHDAHRHEVCDNILLSLPLSYPLGNQNLHETVLVLIQLRLVMVSIVAAAPGRGQNGLDCDSPLDAFGEGEKEVYPSLVVRCVATWNAHHDSPYGHNIPSHFRLSGS